MTMLKSHPQPPEDLVAHLLHRISELEDENSNLRRLKSTIRGNIRVFDALMSRCHVGILLLTPEMTIVRLLQSVLGYSESELPGENVLSLFHPEDASEAAEAFHGLLNRQARTRVIECRVRNAEGTWVRLEIEMTDMLDDAHVQAIVFHCRRVGTAA